MKEVKRILNKYGYRCSFQSLHNHLDILKYNKKKDAVSLDKCLTFMTPTGLVIGRIFNIKNENDKFFMEDLEKVIGIFSLYRLPHGEKIITELKESYSKFYL